MDKGNISSLIRQLNEIGILLSTEKNHSRLLELILFKAIEMTNADAGTLYSYTEDHRLKFEIMYNRSLNIHNGGTSGKSIPFPPLPLYDDNGNANHHMVAAHAAVTGKTVNIDDAYNNAAFDFSGTHKFDKKTNYRSVSFLTVPMTDHENSIIGVLQIINAMAPGTDKIIPFSALDQQLVESLASQAAVTITNKTLINAQKQLFDAFIKLIANAVDEKSPYTASHCRRVPVLAKMLADAASNIDTGPLKDFHMTEEEKYELEVAAWLHDCGKITTPEYVVDKSTKLETIFDRIKLVETRLEILKRDLVIEALKAKLNGHGDIDAALKKDDTLQQKLKVLDEEYRDICRYNIGGESLAKADLERITEIANRAYMNSAEEQLPWLTEEEKDNLQIERGTLSTAERQVINNHVTVTIKMLESLPYPKHLKRVPEYAGGHHEKADGTGYPNQLTSEQMSIPARMMAIADIFEALTASDRPYKKAMPLSRALKILGRMKLDNHIDGDLFDVFMHEKIYLDYANQYLDKNQLDQFDCAAIPGYAPLK